MGMDAEHYKNILIAPMAYGQSLTILALAEALNVYTGVYRQMNTGTQGLPDCESTGSMVK